MGLFGNSFSGSRSLTELLIEDSVFKFFLSVVRELVQTNSESSFGIGSMRVDFSKVLKENKLSVELFIFIQIDSLVFLSPLIVS